MFGEKIKGSLVSIVYNIPGLFIYQLGGGLAVGFIKSRFSFAWQVKRYISNLFIHSKCYDLWQGNDGKQFIWEASEIAEPEAWGYMLLAELNNY